MVARKEETVGGKESRKRGRKKGRYEGRNKNRKGIRRNNGSKRKEERNSGKMASRKWGTENGKGHGWNYLLKRTWMELPFNEVIHTHHLGYTQRLKSSEALTSVNRFTEGY